MLSVPNLPRATQQHRAKAFSFLDDTCSTNAFNSRRWRVEGVCKSSDIAKGASRLAAAIEKVAVSLSTHR